MSIPKELRRRRLKLSMAQADVGRLSDVDTDTVRNLENGNGSINALEKVLPVLGVQISHIPKAKTLGVSLKMLRQKLGFSQRALAQKAGTSHPSIGSLERSQGHVNTLYVVLPALGIRPGLSVSKARSKIAGRQATGSDKQRKLLEQFIRRLGSQQYLPKRELSKVLSEQDFEEIEDRWENRKQFKADQLERPGELDRYMSMLRKADLLNGQLGRFSEKHRDDPRKFSAVERMANRVDGAYEEALECLQETLEQRVDLEAHFDRPIRFEPGHEPGINADGMPRWWRSKSHYVLKREIGIGSKRDVQLEMLTEKLEQLNEPNQPALDKDALNERLIRLRRQNSRI
ncbi:MAG: helix-turn-helix domain-containing protein [Alphaproteobacteria bacterium]|nr:helix-turn-helix domain-containing protein [Alphaproteobacteria bacterium]